MKETAAKTAAPSLDICKRLIDRVVSDTVEIAETCEERLRLPYDNNATFYFLDAIGKTLTQYVNNAPLPMRHDLVEYIIQNGDFWAKWKNFDTVEIGACWGN